MEKKPNGCGTIVVAMIFMLLIAIAIALVSCSTQAANAAIPEKELKVDSVRDAKIINAYSKLDELLDGDWNHTFEFWSKQDSIEYHLNWNHVDIITNMYENGD